MKNYSTSFKTFRTILSISIAIILFNSLLFAQKLDPQKRRALVIGNSKYEFAPLANPIRDARLIGETLDELNFKVTLREDLKIDEMKKSIEEFSSTLTRDSVAVFYFAGHGFQVSGKSFIIPIDFKLTNKPEAFVKSSIDVDELISTVSQRSGLNIIILDSCRNGEGKFLLPEKGGNGFTPQIAPAGTLIAYSTSPGKTAEDGGGDNSLYSLYLAENLRMRPSRVEDVFKRTRLQMINYTGDAQIPWENSSLVSDFYFSADMLAPKLFITPKNTVVKSVPTLIPRLPFDIKSLLPNKFITPSVNAKGISGRSSNGSGRFYSERGNSIEMVEIKGSQFQMGSTANDVDEAYENARRYNDETTRETITAEMPAHLVNVPGFFMSRTEITQAQWQAVMGSLPNIEPKLKGVNFPVVNVSWREAVEFCNKLSNITNRTYRLPTEAEWEYAARGGTNTPFSLGESINSALVNHIGNAPFASAPRGEYRQKTVAVGTLNNANAFGLYDMNGNVWEWTQDVWHPDYDNAPNDGSSWDTTLNEDDEPYRVIRGGSWNSIANSCRSAYRRKQPAARSYKLNSLGFRIVSN